MGSHIYRAEAAVVCFAVFFFLGGGLDNRPRDKLRGEGESRAGAIRKGPTHQFVWLYVSWISYPMKRFVGGKGGGLVKASYPRQLEQLLGS